MVKYLKPQINTMSVQLCNDSDIHYGVSGLWSSFYKGGDVNILFIFNSPFSLRIDVNYGPLLFEEGCHGLPGHIVKTISWMYF